MGSKLCQSSGHALGAFMDQAADDVLMEYAACKSAMVYVGWSSVLPT